MTDATATKLAALEQRLATLEARDAITQLLASYGPAADSCDMGVMTEIWHEDCSFVAGGLVETHGHAGLAQVFDGDFHRAITANGSAHITTTPYIVLDGDTAVATNYGTLFAHKEGRFICKRLTSMRWELTRGPDGRWRVLKRTTMLLDGQADARALLAQAFQ